MENNNTIDKNPNNNSPNQGVSFAKSNTPGFLVSNKRKKETEIIEEKTNTQEENNEQKESNTSLLRKQSIDVIEEAKNEFENTNANTNSIFADNMLLVAQNPIQPTEEINTEIDNSELINNPSSIFNIPLIANNEILNNTTNNTDINTNGEQKNIENKDIAGTTIITPNIDFFSFDFSTTSQTVEDDTPKIEAVTKTDDDVIHVDFNSVIRASDNQEVIPEQNDRVELTKFLEPKENLIKKPDEVSEEDNNVIRINDDSSSDSYRSKNNIINQPQITLI